MIIEEGEKHAVANRTAQSIRSAAVEARVFAAESAAAVTTDAVFNLSAAVLPRVGANEDALATLDDQVRLNNLQHENALRHNITDVRTELQQQLSHVQAAAELASTTLSDSLDAVARRTQANLTALRAQTTLALVRQNQSLGARVDAALDCVSVDRERKNRQRRRARGPSHATPMARARSYTWGCMRV